MGRAGAVALAGLFKLCKIGLESDMASWRIQRYGVGSNAAAFKNSMQCTRIHPQLFNQKKLKTRSKKTKHIRGKMPLLTAEVKLSNFLRDTRGHAGFQHINGSSQPEATACKQLRRCETSSQELGTQRAESIHFIRYTWPLRI